MVPAGEEASGLMKLLISRLADPATSLGSTAGRATFCISNDELRFAPRHVDLTIPAGERLPREGEVVYLDAYSAWGVTMVIHERAADGTMSAEVWLSHVGASRLSAEDAQRVLQ